MPATYTIGVDFGTASGRVVICDSSTGVIISEDITTYKHGVLDKALPNGESLPNNYALQHPQDYLDVLHTSIPSALVKGNILKEQVIGIGVDFTSSTVIPTDKDGTPLCFKDKWKNNPHAFAKLWKHHGAMKQAEHMQLVYDQGPFHFLKNYGESISCEWMVPKILEVAEEDFALYEEATYFVEAIDWISFVLTGNLVRSNCSAGFKAFWDEDNGFPQAFFDSCSSLLAMLPQTKLSGTVAQVGDKAGELTTDYAKLLQLRPGTAVAVGMIDAHAAVLGTGSVDPRTLVMVMGTSTCHLLVDQESVEVPGISGSVKNGIVKDMHAYEAGQSAVGDLFAAFVDQMVPENIAKQAQQEQLPILAYLEQKLGGVKAGSTGLLALDWHNGNRSPHNLPHASGSMLGLTLQTKSEEIFLALMEATAFGARSIIENYRDAGLTIDKIVAAGGLPLKNRRLMEVYASVLNQAIHISSTPHAPAVGAAILGAAAAPKVEGGYETVLQASKKMGDAGNVIIYPENEDVERYNQLYTQYKRLAEFQIKALEDLHSCHQKEPST
ncbi:ribulokinase [Shouchella sp. 1P09AA]|uniref:ribulokinase n=1 Tax=unclassified Shouchella TaxID=2893065 RepID=UPI0039A2C0C7